MNFYEEGGIFSVSSVRLNWRRETGCENENYGNERPP